MQAQPKAPSATIAVSDAERAALIHEARISAYRCSDKLSFAYPANDPDPDSDRTDAEALDIINDAIVMLGNAGRVLGAALAGGPFAATPAMCSLIAEVRDRLYQSATVDDEWDDQDDPSNRKDRERFETLTLMVARLEHLLDGGEESWMRTRTIPEHLRGFLLAAAGCDLLGAADTIHGGTLDAYPWPGIDEPASAEKQAEFEAARIRWRDADKLIDQLSITPKGEDVTLDADVAQRLIEESIGELRGSLDQMAGASPDEIVRAAEVLRDLEALATAAPTRLGR